MNTIETAPVANIPHAKLASPGDLPAIRRRWHAWVTLVLGLVAALAFLAWSAHGTGPLAALPWGWTINGWLTPIPSFAAMWLAVAILFTLLSVLAYFLFTTPSTAVRLKPWVSIAMILLVAAAARCTIAATWSPLTTPTDVADAAKYGLLLPPVTSSNSARMELAAIDLIIVALLISELLRQQRSVWWAALYAWHPLPLVEIAGNGWPTVIILLGFLALLLLALRFRWLFLLTDTLIILAGALILIASLSHPFNGLGHELISQLLLHGNTEHIFFPLLLADGIVLLILGLTAAKLRWHPAKTLGHVIVIHLLFCPAVYPAYALWPLALLPLAWNRAAWLLSLTIFAAYAAPILLRLHHSSSLPDWLLLLTWIPIAILELQSLTTALLESLRTRKSEI